MDRLPLTSARTWDKTWDQAFNPGMHPDRESNQQLFTLRADAQPTKPQQSRFFFYFYLLRFYLLIFRERGRERKRKGEDHWLVVSRGPGLQPRHMPQPGIELVTLWFVGRWLTHWATPVRATIIFLMSFQNLETKVIFIKVLLTMKPILRE